MAALACSNCGHEFLEHSRENGRCSYTYKKLFWNSSEEDSTEDDYKTVICSCPHFQEIEETPNEERVRVSVTYTETVTYVREFIAPNKDKKYLRRALQIMNEKGVFTVLSREKGSIKAEFLPYGPLRG